MILYFDYCDVIYSTATKDDLDRLQRLQNKCLKICLGLHKRHETADLHAQADSPYLEDRRNAHVCNYMFKRKSRGGLLADRDISTRLHDATLFKVPFPHKETFKRAIIYAGATDWNSLPVDMRNYDDYQVFKFHQKKKMLESIPKR